MKELRVEYFPEVLFMPDLYSLKKYVAFVLSAIDDNKEITIHDWVVPEAMDVEELVVTLLKVQYILEHMEVS